MLLQNMKVNYNPLILCNTLFNIVLYDTNIKGYWQSKGKLYIDNIEILYFPLIHNIEFKNKLKTLFNKGEEAIFYKNYFNEGIILYPNGKKDILKNRQEILYNYKPSKKEIEKLLKNCEGLTLYKIDNIIYLIEIYN